MEQTWIKVKTSEGMFSSEYAVSLELSDGKTVSFFADKSIVNTEGVNPLLKVYHVHSDPELKKMRVLLPVETLETNARWVDVPETTGSMS